MTTCLVHDFPINTTNIHSTHSMKATTTSQTCHILINFLQYVSSNETQYDCTE